MKPVTRKDVEEIVEEKVEEIVDRRFGVIMEYFDSKFDTLIEAFQGLASITAKASELQIVKEDVAIMKVVLTETNQDLKQNERRITALEASA